MPERAATRAWPARLKGGGPGNLFVVLLTAVAVAIGAWVVMRPDADGGSPVSTVEVRGVGAVPRVGDKAPGFTAATLDGARVSLDQLRGRPVWLVFMATWCAGCRVEVPDVQEIHERAGAAGVQVVAVYVGEDAPAAESYAKRLGLTFPQVPDAGTTLSASYGVRGVPAHYFLDGSGTVREARVGALGPEQMREAISKASA